MSQCPGSSVSERWEASLWLQASSHWASGEAWELSFLSKFPRALLRKGPLGAGPQATGYRAAAQASGPEAECSSRETSEGPTSWAASPSAKPRGWDWMGECCASPVPLLQKVLELPS